MNAPERLTFDPVKHEYRWDGLYIVNVTKVLEEVANWDCVPRDILRAAQERGTRVHIATAYDDEGDLNEATVLPEEMPYIEAYRKFRDEVKPKWSGIEKRVFHGLHRYAGTLDRYGEMFGEESYLDVKSGDTTPVHQIQLSAYLEADRPGAKKVPARYVLQLKRDGTYKLHKITSNHRTDFAMYLSLLNVWRWKQEHGV